MLRAKIDQSFFTLKVLYWAQNHSCWLQIYKCHKFFKHSIYINHLLAPGCMEYCCHVWASVPSCYLELLDKLQKQICRIVGPSLAVSLNPHCQNVASWSLFYRYYFGRCSSKLIQLVPLPYSWRRSTCPVILIDGMIFLSPLLDVTRMSISTVSFFIHLDSGILCLENAFFWPMI